jgi:quercetin dioxygenase-like cupin family protein
MATLLGARTSGVFADAREHSPGDPMPHQCVILAPGDVRPEFGCFRIGIVKNLKLNGPIYWHLSTFSSRAAADSARSANGIVVEEDGHIWLSEFGSRNRHSRGGHGIALVGPLNLLPAKSYDVEIAYSVMQPSDHSRVHTHAGPEAWYVLSGTQCLETPEGAHRAGVGSTMSAAPNRPMELRVTGTDVARALTLVIHDSTLEFGTASNWRPTGACRSLKLFDDPDNADP